MPLRKSHIPVKYFSGRLKEQNGEQENYYYNIIKAKNLAEAEKFYDEYAKTFYSDDEVEKNGDGYDFFGGTLYVEVMSVSPTTKKEWLKEQFIGHFLTASRKRA